MGRRNRAGRGGGVKLTEWDASRIYRARGLQREIADRYGISPRMVSNIKRGERWDCLHHVPGPYSPLRYFATGFRIVATAVRSLTGLQR